jgi:hypothetical protein
MEDYGEEEPRLLEQLSDESKILYRLLNSRLSRLQLEMNSLRTEMRLQGSGLRAEIYRTEAKMLWKSSGGGGEIYESPFTMEVIPQSLGNSATDPDYDLFTDKDYGLF